MGPAEGHTDPTGLFAFLGFIFVIGRPLGGKAMMPRKSCDLHGNTPFCRLILEAPQITKSPREVFLAEVRPPQKVVVSNNNARLFENRLGNMAPIQVYYSEFF